MNSTPAGTRTIQNVAVVGAGSMGRQISILAAINGLYVRCVDSSVDELRDAESFAAHYLKSRVKKGRLSQADVDSAASRLSFVATLHEAVADSDFVIEAVVEDLAIKREVFAAVSELVDKQTILATNSSAIVSSKLADVVSGPHRLINMHFFNPALVMELVEVVKGPHVSTETANTTMELARRLGKVAILLEKEIKGFLLNRLLDAIQREAHWLLDMGVASVKDIDMACVHGAGHPMGPFQLEDLTGLDLSYMSAMADFRESGDPAELPGPSLMEHYVNGRYGKKVGRGWYEYP